MHDKCPTSDQWIHEGKGSLASYLKNEVGLVSSIYAGTVQELSDVETLVVSVEFTPDGFGRKDEVIAAIFSYLDLIRKEGVFLFFFLN